MSDQETNHERLEGKMEFETEKPSPAAEAQAVFGLSVETTQPVINHPANIGAPLPATGTGVHGENVSTPKPEPKVGDYVARDTAKDLEAQSRGEISPLYDLKPKP
jgi:hypothetical protein